MLVTSLNALLYLQSWVKSTSDNHPPHLSLLSLVGVSCLFLFTAWNITHVYSHAEGLLLCVLIWLPEKAGAFVLWVIGSATDLGKPERQNFSRCS